jgi:tetratricopeptide (TPR) repeat protein
MSDPLPQSSVELAQRRYREGDLAGAVEAFRQAAQAYAAAGDAVMAAEMQNNQAVTLLRLKKAEAALELVRGTERIFAEAGDARREGMALANLATALQALRRPGEAIEAYRRSAEALERADEGDLRAEVMQLLSMLYLRRLKFYDAVLALQSGLAGVKNPTPRQRLMKKLVFFRL